ncbi:MAG: carboxypeptidase-like regulatory domain-containing protein [Alistipes sp.]|nr:carboxypeptidase-like regulatory domain-containing protein [Candidatus Alistipes equi]
MRKFYLIVLFALMSGILSAQTTKTYIRGEVCDEKGQPLGGASVVVPGTSIGVTVDMDGTFAIAVPEDADALSISFIGYNDCKIDLAGKKNLGQIKMEPSAQMLEDVVISQSVAVQRKTPVAVSSLDFSYVEERLGAQEFPEILKATPGVYATKDGGGYGDSKINMRGFQSANVAVSINGVPMNDMEWGGIYWSNFAGLSDVTRSIQTQRGLGASKLSSPSVGGTINILTRTFDAKRGGTFNYGIGNDGANTISLSLSTGLTKNGWALTVMGGKKWGNGYIQGTEFDGYNYFVNVSKRINTRHQLSFTAFGAPQGHNQRSSYDGLTIKGWESVQRYMGSDSKYKYNPTFGYDKNGQRRTSAYNKYHKPILMLNHQWQIDSKSSLSSVVYASIARGFGYSGDGESAYANSWYGCSNGVLNTQFRKPDGTFDYGAIQDLNAQSETGSKMVMTENKNNHNWIGGISTYTNQLKDWLELSVGIDMRYYKAEHTKEIIDLYDGAYYIDRYRKNVKPADNAAAADPAWVNQKLGVGDNIYRDYDGHVLQAGAFAQLEFTKGDWNAFVSGSLSNSTYWRVDRFYYDAAHEKSEKINFIAGTVKAGANYNINKYNNVFANIGYISRAPFYSGGAFLNATTSNATNPDAVNEKVISAEVGYGFHNEIVALNFNAYYTLWKDKTMMKSSDMTYVSPTTGETINGRWIVNMTGVNAQHMGLELDFTVRPLRWLDIKGMVSVGNWKWDNNPTGYFYNEAGQPLKNTKGDIASGVGAEDHLKSTIEMKDIKVGGSAQTTAMLGLTFKPMKGLRVGADWVVYANNYADYTINYNNITPGGTTKITSPWRIPWGNQIDLMANYSFKIGNKVRATLYGNVNNVFNNFYIVDAYEGGTSTWDSAYRVFYAFGRTYSIRLKINF